MQIEATPRQTLKTVSNSIFGIFILYINVRKQSEKKNELTYIEEKMTKIDPEKKKAYNKAYREKQKLLKAPKEKPLEPEPEIEIEKIRTGLPIFEKLEPQTTPTQDALEKTVEPEETPSETPSMGSRQEAFEDIVTLDREAYEFLLENYKKVQNTEQTEPQERSTKTENAKTETNIISEDPKLDKNESFFFQLVQGTKTALATTIPLLALTYIANGVRSYNTRQTTNTTSQPNPPSQRSGPVFHQPVVNLDC